ncbi:MAG: nucleotidyltransferase family protein [Bacteroidia bacterium]|nr:nucleotidyltransferase family protein [Bacteroidia bacterium]
MKESNEKKREAIILAGGFGTRLQSLVSDVPKPMAPVAGRPFLSYLLGYLAHFKISKAIISTGYLGDKIKSFYKDSFDTIQIAYTAEDEPLGTGGALKLAINNCETEHILVLNGDSFFDVDLGKFAKAHLNSGASFSLALRKVENSSRYGTIELDGTKITAFREKDGFEKEGIINAGVYIVKRSFFLANCPADEKFSLEKDFLEKLVEKFTFTGYLSDSYFIDIGIPEDYNRAQHDFKEFKY